MSACEMGKPPHDEPLPLHNADSERSLLGGLLLNGNSAAIEGLLGKIEADDFFNPLHRKVFAAMQRLSYTNTSISLDSLYVELTGTNELDSEQLAHVSTLADGMPRVSNIEYHAGIVRKLSNFRRFLYSQERLRSMASEARDFGALLTAWRQELDCLAERDTNKSIFCTWEEYVATKELTFAIAGFLPNNGINGIAGLVGENKTWCALSVCRALFEGKGAKLWNHFEVLETAEQCVYLAPEVTLPAIKYRLEKLRMATYIKNGQLLLRTLSDGPKLPLSDPRILAAAKRGAHFFVDTMARYTAGEDKEDFLPIADDLFALLSAGARTVDVLAHSPKAFAKDGTPMTLENMVRGTSDIGAIFETCWGLKMLDKESNIVHFENLKPRDFAKHPEPFRLTGRPYIDEDADFKMTGEPGQVESLADARPRRGASPEQREGRERNLALVSEWLAANPNITEKEMVEKFAQEGIKVNGNAVSGNLVRQYKHALKKRESE